MKTNPVVEMVAAQLHKEYRAAFIAMHSGFSTFMGVGRQKRNFGTGCKNEHDHGWSNCTKKKYFLRRATMHIRNANIEAPQTLGEAEMALAATVLLRRLSVEGKLRFKKFADGGIVKNIGPITIHSSCNISSAFLASVVKGIQERASRSTLHRDSSPVRECGGCGAANGELCHCKPIPRRQDGPFER